MQCKEFRASSYGLRLSQYAPSRVKYFRTSIHHSEVGIVSNRKLCDFYIINPCPTRSFFYISKKNIQLFPCSFSFDHHSFIRFISHCPAYLVLACLHNRKIPETNILDTSIDLYGIMSLQILLLLITSLYCS